MTRKIKLNKANSLQDTNKNSTLRVNLSNDKKPIISDNIVDTIDEYTQYLIERKACDKIRLSIQVNLMTSNVLFNEVTEIVKNEGSDDCECLNFEPRIIPSTIGKPKDFVWGENIKDCIQDTQITSSKDEDKNYTYLPGIDIFNNHVLRSKNSIPVFLDNNEPLKLDFNTISEYICDVNGRKPLSRAYSKKGVNTMSYLHIYRKNNLMTFTESLSENLQDRNGWLGFVNRSKMTSYNRYGNIIDISRVLNNENVNKFIEMYPNSSHYKLLPYYNKHRHRSEKNWEYGLFYPHSSIDKNIPCINSELKTLKIVMVNEEENDDDGLEKTTIFSSCKHGLKVGDTINIYKSNEENTAHILFMENVVIDSIIDDYTFNVYIADNICEKWVSVFDNDKKLSIFFSEWDKSQNTYIRHDGKVISSFGNKLNVDFDSDGHIGSQNLSFTKTVSGEECKYYVRIFSRLPNFEFMDGTVNETTIYNSMDGLGQAPVDYYANRKFEHQSILSKLAYAKNIYNDDMHQIVYTDDICFSHLHDNLGRPLSSLYLCFTKTNYGRKEWYKGNVSNIKVEHSHCFGKVNCGLELSPYAMSEEYYSGNTRTMNNIEDGCNGLDQTPIRGKQDGYDDDEIIVGEQQLMYGDLCEYSAMDCKEKVLQPIVHRFNTQQRELSSLEGNVGNFNAVKYDEIIFDDYSYDAEFTVNSFVYDSEPTKKREGYVYQSAYEIPLMAWSNEIVTSGPIDLNLYDILYKDGVYLVTTNDAHMVNVDSRIILYNTITAKSYNFVVSEIASSNTLKGLFLDENKVNLPIEESKNVAQYRLYKVPNNVPDYVNLSNDGSGIFRWRYLYENGFEPIEGMIEEYPFTNNTLYVNKLVNVFVRRQDPFGTNSLSFSNVNVLNGKPSSNKVMDDIDFVNEKDAIC